VAEAGSSSESTDWIQPIVPVNQRSSIGSGAESVIVTWVASSATTSAMYCAFA
jgi:hypothetical protein